MHRTTTPALVLGSLLTGTLAWIGCDGAPTGSDETLDAAPTLESDDEDARTTPMDASAPTSEEVTVTGAILGTPFDARGAAGRRFWWTHDDGTVGPGLSFGIGEYASMCTAAAPKLARMLAFYLRGTGTSETTGLSISAGTYTIVKDTVRGGTGAPPEGTVYAVRLDGECGFALDDTATGTASLSKVDTTEIEGTFDLTLTTSGHVTGSFVVPICKGLPRGGDRPDTTAWCSL